MPRIRSIAILLHERHWNAQAKPYRIWALAANWRTRGITVEPVFGIGSRITADLLIPHLDMSYIPDDYWDFIQGHPLVVNRHVRDIRKRAVSAQLVRPGDGWQRPVVVKTDDNARGWLDAWFRAPAPPSRLESALDYLDRRLFRERSRLSRVRSLEQYHVFDSIRDVPAGVWTNQALVVERFVPERRGESYVVRCYTFFGGSSRALSFAGPDPIVKVANSERAPCELPPDSIVAARRRLNVDFAKMDYVIHDGEAVLLDVNTTPFMGGPIDAGRIMRSAELADGIVAFERD